MNETLEILLAGVITPILLGGGIFTLTNLGHYVNAHASYSKLKEQFPESYKEKINLHYDRMKARCKGYYADQKYMALPGINLAKNQVLKN